MATKTNLILLFVCPLRRKEECWLTMQGILWSCNLSNHLCHLRSKNFPKCYISNCNFINRTSVLAENLTYHLLMGNRRLWQKQLSLNSRDCLCRKLGDEEEDMYMFIIQTLLSEMEGGRKWDNPQELRGQLAWHNCLKTEGKDLHSRFSSDLHTCCSTSNLYSYRHIHTSCTYGHTQRLRKKMGLERWLSS